MKIPVLSILPLAVLTACGGGGGGGSAGAPTGGSGPVALQQPGLFDQQSTAASTLVAHAVTTTDAGAMRLSGLLDRAGNAVSLGSDNGTITGDRRTITFPDGAVYVLNGDGDAVSTFTMQSPHDAPMFGVIGIPTGSGDHPSGVAQYTGNGQVQVVDGQAVYDLTGTSTATADFADGRVDLAITSLAGIRTAPNGTTSTVQNAGSLMVDQASISGLTFSGGQVALNSGSFSTQLSGNQTTSSSGGFYGPGATEIGAVVKVDDTTDGSLLINGVLTGE